MAVLAAAFLALQASAAAPELPSPPTRDDPWDDFPVFVWRQRHQGRALPEHLFEPFGGTNVERDENADWVRERGGTFYVGHAPGRNELHLRREGELLQRWKRWYRTRDESLLVRDPCLTDPKTRSKLFTQLEKSLSGRDGDHGLGISLGDEISLTPWGDPWDICRSSTCEAAWKQWCQREGLEPMHAPTTDEARVALVREEYDLLGPWLARRRFHHDVVASLVIELAERARELAPGVPIGVLGTSGRSAFGGLALEKVLPHLDFVEPYPVDDARELCATVAPDVKRLVTIFADDPFRVRRTDRVAHHLWTHFLRGGDGAVLWSDKLLDEDELVRRRLERDVALLRRIRQEIGEFRPTPAGVAVVHSPDSIAFRWLKDAALDGPTWPNRLAGYQREHGTRERSLQAWLRLFEDAGYLPGALPIEHVDATTVERFSLLVLSHVAIVSSEEANALVRYVEAGGAVVIEGEFARFDERGIERPESLRTRLEKAAGDRALVREPPRRLLEIARLRRNSWTGELTALRQFASWLGEVPGRASFDIDSIQAISVHASVPTDDGWICVAVPAEVVSEDSAYPRLPGSYGSSSRVVVPPGFDIEWIHPPEDPAVDLELVPRSMRGGSPIVFRLRRSDNSER